MLPKKVKYLQWEEKKWDSNFGPLSKFTDLTSDNVKLILVPIYK